MYDIPPEIDKAEVCKLSAVASLVCVDENGHKVLEASVLKSNDFWDTEPKFTKLSTIAVMRKFGFELRASDASNPSTDNLILVRDRRP